MKSKTKKDDIDSLFENVMKNSILDLVDENTLKEKIVSKLNSTLDTNNTK